jgi:hypothetical protein
MVDLVGRAVVAGGGGDEHAGIGRVQEGLLDRSLTVVPPLIEKFSTWTPSRMARSMAAALSEDQQQFLPPVASVASL